MEFDVPVSGSNLAAIFLALIQRSKGSGRPPTLTGVTANGKRMVFRWNPGQERAVLRAPLPAACLRSCRAACSLVNFLTRTS